jgi:ferredoxin
LRAIEPAEPAPQPANFLPFSGKRDVLRFALSELQRAAPEPIDVVALPVGAPFGKVEIDVNGCTLCLACVSACPTGALGDNSERPLLRFDEAACVQCGLCKATCPEKVITLVPQLDFRASTAPARVLKEEEPFLCIHCGKPFGVKSTIERIAAKLEGTHWMYQSAKRLDIIRMCEDCRVIAITADNLDPHDVSARPKVRTSEDYLREREKQERRQKKEA